MFSHLTTSDIVTIARTLALLLEAGVPIHTAISSLLSSTVLSRASRSLLTRAKAHIEDGYSLHDTFSNERALGPVFVTLVQAGERSGTLPRQLTVAADWLEREKAMHTNVASATLYPKIIFGASVLVAGGLATFILPQLIPLFVGMHIPLPFATKVLIEGASFLKTHWFVLLVGLCVFSVFYIYLRRIPPVRYYLDRFRLKVPFLGPLEEAHQLTVSARVIATLYESGIDVPGAIRIASGTCTNTVYVQAWATIAKVTESGEPVSTALTRYPHLFRNEFLLLTSVGEQSGTIAPTFRRLADHYEEQINLMIKRLPAVIEPLLLIMMTVLVGFVATAIMLPVYEFSTGFAR